MFNQSCIDCKGVVNGTALIDGCGYCLDINSPDFYAECPYDSLIYIPSAFSPNGDATNDLFQIFSKSGTLNRIVSYRIFDRWGSLIYQRLNFDPYGRGNWWDGTLSNSTANQSVFTYLFEVEFSNGFVKTFKGDITLMK